MDDTDGYRVTSLDEIRELVGEPVPGLEVKVGGVVDDDARAFLAKSPFVVLSTADAEGNVDASPKGDEPGFVLVEDESTIVLPDRHGNKLVMGHQNILANPHVGLLFVIPGTTETLRINGRAELTAAADLLERLSSRGKPALLAIRVHVDECFLHCSKAFLRSRLWKPDTWPEKQKISFGRQLAPRYGATGDDVEKVAAFIDEQVEEDYRTNV